MSDVIDLKKERIKRENTEYACPECKEKGQVCPGWISAFWNDNEGFRLLPIRQKLEWFRHTKHLP